MADFLLERPIIHFGLPQAQAEAKEATKIKDRGWQEAAYEIYPLKINLFRIEEGTFVYKEHGTDLRFPTSTLMRRTFATSIQGSASIRRTSHLAATVDQANLRAEGHANFLEVLEEPYAGIRTDFTIEKLPRSRFQAVLRHYNFDVRSG